MPSPFSAALILVTTIWGTAVYAAAEPLREVSQDVTRLIQTEGSPQARFTPAASLETGAVVYSETGEHIGAIQALTRSGIEYKTVWIGRTAYPAAAITTVNNRLVILSDTNAIESLYAAGV